jgi:hypothetical protein
MALNRSIDRDYDIPEHLKGIEDALKEIQFHLDGLEGVGYDPVNELRKINEFCVKITTSYY